MTFPGSARAWRAGIGALAKANFFCVRAPRFSLWLCGLQLQYPGEVSAGAPKLTREGACAPQIARNER